ncbi:nicotinamide mononucleotide transporter family protein [Streptomyces rhizosphaericus]|uniref:nicotinamide mononucleotide transporter family protein n=1 Tax=Streptomyces rhizosphaericus TaxID=114699 RepID=UPI000A35D904|nr:nicotinamide mononucleotide transporter family protein [Streptomyces rhizosphaericus]
MTPLNWLTHDVGQLFGQRVLWSDMLGNGIGLIGLTLVKRRSPWTWPAQIAAGAVLLAAYASTHLISGVGKQLLVIGVALWGWHQWRRGYHAEGSTITVRLGTAHERVLLVAATATGTGALGAVFCTFPGLSWQPWADAYFFVGTVTAMLAQARGLVECWAAWMLVDLVGIPMAFSNGLVISGLVYLTYLMLVVSGARDWWQHSQRAVPGPCGPEAARP